MKKGLVGLVIFVVVMTMFSVGQAQTPQANLSATVAGSLWTDDHFSSVGGSLLIGGQSALDLDKSLFARIAYHRKNYGSAPAHYLDLSAIEYWHLGEKLKFYVSPIFSVGISDGAGNPLSIGGGVEYKLFQAPFATISQTEVPFSIHTYGDLTFSENSTQIMFGLRFSKPQK